MWEVYDVATDEPALVTDELAVANKTASIRLLTFLGWEPISLD